MYVLIVGTPVDGYHFYGPFISHIQAVKAAKASPIADLDWCVSELKTREELSNA